MDAPSLMISVRAARLISAPALIARPETQATVGSSLARMASRMRTAASMRPPKVSTRRRTASAPPASASAMARSTKGARPISMVPVMGISVTRRAP